MYDGYPLATDAIALAAETVSPTRTYDAGFQVVLELGDSVYVEAFRHNEVALVTLETPGGTVFARSQVTCDSTDPRVAAGAIVALVNAFVDAAELLTEAVTS